MARLWATNISNYFVSKAKFNPPVPEAVWQRPSYFVAFGFGSGAMPFAPGTFGTLMAIPFYLLASQLSLPYYLAITLVLTIVAIGLCGRISKEINVQDHPGMCIDEFVGFFVTMINAPHGWHWVALGFVLFRLFDILKPWPIGFIDKKIHGGIGMVLDDILAGVFGLAIIQLLKIIIAH